MGRRQTEGGEGERDWTDITEECCEGLRGRIQTAKKRTSECRGNKSRKLIINDKSPALATKQC